MAYSHLKNECQERMMLQDGMICIGKVVGIKRLLIYRDSVFIGDTLTTDCEITELIPKSQ